MGLVRSQAAALMCSVALGVMGVQASAAQTVNVNATKLTLLERLVIGAGKAKVAIDTPQAVTVVNQDDIDAAQAGSTGEILDDIPGVTMIGSERVLGESFNMRGIGAAETSGDESRIIITVDGAKKFYEQYRMGSFFSDPELYKRVEVLRGPASSTLYGSGAFGGVINFTTKDAADFIQEGKTGAARIKGTYTSNGNGTLTSAIVAQRVSDTFEILAAGNYRRSDLQRLANGGTLVGSDFQAWSGLLKGTMHLDDEQVVRLSYQRWNSDADNQPYAATGTVVPPVVGGSQDFGSVDRNVTDQTTVLSYENPASDNDMLDLKVQLSYSDTAVSQSNATYAFQSASNNFFVADYAYKTVQLNAQNTSTFSGDNWVNDVTYGFQASNQSRVAVPKTGTIITTHPEGTATNIGVFAQSEHTIDDKLTLIGGARVDFSHLAPSAALAVSTPKDDVAFSPKVAAIYRFNENFNVFGSAAHTERMPTLDEMFQYSGTRSANLNLQKEYSDNYEAGFGLSGYDLLTEGDTIGIKTTAFVNNITNGIRSNPITANAPYFVNIAGMRLWGLEIEGSYETDFAYARLAYTLTRGEYTQSFAATSALNARSAGTALDGLPQDKVVLTVGGRAYDQQLDFGAKVTVAANPITYVDTSPATGKPDGWATVDLFAGWKPQEGSLAGLQAQVSVENIFDTDYRENLSMDRSRGRTFKLSLSKQFDW